MVTYKSCQCRPIIFAHLLRQDPTDEPRNQKARGDRDENNACYPLEIPMMEIRVIDNHDHNEPLSPVDRAEISVSKAQRWTFPTLGTDNRSEWRCAHHMWTCRARSRACKALHPPPYETCTRRNKEGLRQRISHSGTSVHTSSSCLFGTSGMWFAEGLPRCREGS